MSINPKKFKTNIDLGKTIIGGALQHQFENTTFILTDEVQEAIQKYGMLMLNTGYLEGISRLEKASIRMQKEVMKAKIDMPRFPHFNEPKTPKVKQQDEK